MKPTPEDNKSALAVLRYYAKHAHKLAKDTNQELPAEWSVAFDTIIDLFARGKDPDDAFRDYRVEFQAGRVNHPQG